MARKTDPALTGPATLLVLTTSTDLEAVGLFRDGVVVDSEAQTWRRGAPRKTLAMLDALLRRQGGISVVDAIAADVGPGSFTGLRLGLSIARALATFDDLPTLPVGSMDAMIDQLRSSGVIGPLVIALPSRARHFYVAVVDGAVAARSHVESDRASAALVRELNFEALVARCSLARNVGDTTLVAPAETLAMLTQRGIDGDGFELLAPALQSIAAIATRASRLGHFGDLVPTYAAVSEAERALATPLPTAVLPVKQG